MRLTRNERLGILLGGVAAVLVGFAVTVAMLFGGFDRDWYVVAGVGLGFALGFGCVDAGIAWGVRRDARERRT